MGGIIELRLSTEQRLAAGPQSSGTDEHGAYVQLDWRRREDFSCGCANKKRHVGWSCDPVAVQLDPAVRVYTDVPNKDRVRHPQCGQFLGLIINTDKYSAQGGRNGSVNNRFGCPAKTPCFNFCSDVRNK